MSAAPPDSTDASDPVAEHLSLAVVLREWGRIGCIGFGGPPAHIALFRELCVERRGWLTPEDFQDAIATTNLLPGPGSTQMAIFCAWRVRGVWGALVGGAAFIVPGLVLIIALSAAVFADGAPNWLRGAAAGAGAAVAAIASRAGADLLRSGKIPAAPARRARWAVYVAVGALAAATVGPWLVLLLLGCGAVELLVGRARLLRGPPALGAFGAAPVLATMLGTSTLVSLGWVALKVGALSYGGGFVVIPLMQADAVHRYHWMSSGQFLDAVALGQVTPGPVTHTVASVGFAAAGVVGALLAAAVAFAPSFSFIMLGADRFDRLRANPGVRRFLDGAGPAASGAILGSAIPLALSLSERWQFAVLAGAVVLALVARRGVLLTMGLAGAIGVVVAIAGGPIP